MKIPPKVGSKVRFAGPLFKFDPHVGVMLVTRMPVEVASDPNDDGMIGVLCPKFGYGHIHLRQITHRIVPKKRREIWINECGPSNVPPRYYLTKDACLTSGTPIIIAVRFVEAREKKK